MQRAIIIAVALAATGTLLTVYFKAFGTDPHAVPFMMVGQKAPLFKITRLDTGEVVDMSKLLGRPVVLNFWATSCGASKQEQPTLNWAADKYKGRVVFLGMVVESEEDATKKWLMEH